MGSIWVLLLLGTASVLRPGSATENRARAPRPIAPRVRIRPGYEPASDARATSLRIAPPFSMPLQPAPTGHERRGAELDRALDDRVLARIDRDLAVREYEVSRNHLGLQAPNRAHDLRTYFDSLGIRLVDRTDPGEPGLLTMRARAIGRSGGGGRVKAGRVRAEGARVQIQRAGLVEWYVNSPAGLEQGFTLETPPAGSGALVVEIGVEGACLRAAGHDIAFDCASGRRMTYGAASAVDARGTSMPVTLEAHEGCVRIVVADAGATYPITIDPLLTSIADTQLAAFQASAGFGRHVAGAGDVNGDGFDDVIVGAEMYDAGEVDEGAAFVFLGGPSGIASNVAPSATLQSNQVQAFFGRVAGAGDVNGDGYADVIVGAHAYDSGEIEEGAAFVFLGGPGGIANGSPATAAATLQGNQTGATFGISEANAGDINGDGYGDVIVGAESYNGTGGAFIFLGSATGIVSGGPASAATSLISNQASASFGFTVAGAGDVNGDGYSDVIVGANRYDAPEVSEGAAFVYLGGPAGIASGSQASAATTLQSNQTGALFGFSVAGAGDVNGDGYSDVIVGAYLFDSGETNEGGAFVFLGRAAGIPSGSVANASATLQSNQAGSSFGARVAGAGDVNGDGYADVIVGASGYDSGQTDEGVAFVFTGGSTGVQSGNPLTAFAKLQGDQASAHFGVEVAGAGDVDGDGHADVIVGAPDYDAGHTDEGVAFIYRGGARGIVGGLDSSAATILQGDQASAQLGFSVAAAGDVNGDGYGDVIVGARLYDAGEADEGAAFVFLGGPTGVASGGASSAVAMLQSDQAGAELGISVAAAGDVNGDGHGDVIVSAPGYDVPGKNEEGVALVYLGGPAGTASGTPATAATMLEGEEESAYLGNSVACAGDVNGDGFADVIVGSYAFGSANEGAAFVFLGSPSGIASGTSATAATRILSTQANADFGNSVAGAGDVNGDGYADVIVGSQFHSLGETFEGAAFVFLGGSNGIPNGSPDAAATTIQSNEANAHLGFSVAGAGDVNGDGYADVIVGVPGYGSVDGGAVFVFHGSASGVPSGSPASANASVVFNDTNAQLGSSVAGAGDVNADGYADVIMGAPGVASLGIAYVYAGGPTGVATNSAMAQLAASQSFEHLGSSVAGAGDVNGDGYADVIVGAVSYTAGENQEGGAFVFLGNGGRAARAVRPSQARGDGSGLLVAPWGSSYRPTFDVKMNAFDPAGRAVVKLEVESCPPGVPFGTGGCTHTVSSAWTDAGATAGAALTRDVAAAAGSLRRWRVRTLHAPLAVIQPGIIAPANPAHGPWRRFQGQRVEGDVRTAAGPLAVTRDARPGTIAIENVANPARSAVAFTVVLAGAGTATVEIFDIVGRRVLSRDLEPDGPGRMRVEAGARDIASGVYLLRVTQSGVAATARFIVAH